MAKIFRWLVRILLFFVLMPVLILLWVYAEDRLGSPELCTCPVDKVVVYKKHRLMELWRADTLVRVYRVALGRKPVGQKTQKGDYKTPEGNYWLDYKNPKSVAYKSIHISYPNQTDRQRARKRGVEAGGDIMIHGLMPHNRLAGKWHTFKDWTAGCIAVTNKEMDELWSCIKENTPISIYE